ncbi:CheR family methyltransferase [Pseudomarimonas arenosa]|uniref:CheR-type methyltransferase domain-containing protein n=1 Tax=Pseudomarimonas arenosa TaxID=2774145 RepID=A0AAW3ZNV4_9GAMM|nr:protein-glutamate O-methyltransferase CheR [Pseudomarimonas arenosa]MBD8526772.1 hypothetical protein [Pseudomarimonas arenosa]
MKPTQHNSTLRSLVDDFSQRLGFHAEAGDRDRLAQAVAERMQVLDIRKPEDYQQRLANRDLAAAELRAVADALIIGETYFFRGADHLEVLRQAWMDEPAERRWRVLSAGCSSGEEPYSLAMIADQLGMASRVRIDAVDVNPRALERAAAGLYSPWSLRDTPEAVRQKYFRQQGRQFELDAHIRGRVQFQECNLLDPQHALWRAPAYDAVFCRNVLIYFSPQVVESVVQKLADLVVEGGFLFLGHAEALQAGCAGIELESTERTVFYRKHGGFRPEATQPDLNTLLAGVQGELQVELPRPAASADWQWAPTTRVTASETTAPPSTRDNEASAAGEVEHLLRQENWSAAEQQLRAAGSSDRRSQVLLAQLCFVNNRIDEAQQRCERLLGEYFLDAELHQLLAMCMEQRGRPKLALEHARRASYLDPKFALPHVLLGRMALKAGQKAAALQEFSIARQRLPEEQMRRLRLLSGGFGRQAMIEYCDNQIRACRGSQ